MTDHIYDATELDCWQRCEQEAFYRHVQHLSGTRDQDAPHAGSTLHVFRNDYFLREDVDAAVQAAKDFWGAYVPAEGEKRTWALLEAMMRAYHEFQGPPSKRGIKVLLGEQPVISEAEQHGGRIDAIEEIGGEIAVDDLKTSSGAMSIAALEAFDHNEQIAGYLDRAEELVDRPVAHAWIEHWFISYRKGGPEPGDFKRHGPVYYSSELRAELREHRRWMIERAETLRRGLRASRKNPFACKRFNSACLFLPVCKADLAVREGIIQSRLATGQWVEKAWDFTKRDA